LVRRFVQVLQIRQGGLAQGEAARGERRELPQAQAHVVDAVHVPLQRAPLGERGHQPVGGGEAEAGPAADVRQGQRRVLVVEGAEYGEEAAGGGRGGHDAWIQQAGRARRQR